MTELWTLLRQEQRPIVLYGMGNGADKLLAVCEKKGVSVSGVFASDGFARGNLFHGMPVMTFDQAKARFGEFTVLLAFASCREEVLGNIRRIAKICPLYVPDLPVMGETLFDLAFYQENEPLFQRARALFADERECNIGAGVADLCSYGSFWALSRFGFGLLVGGVRCFGSSVDEIVVYQCKGEQGGHKNCHYCFY